MAKAIAIKVDEDLFRDIHIRAAKKGLSTQQYVTGLIARDLFPKQAPESGHEQLEQIRRAALAVETSVSQIREILDDPPKQDCGYAAMDIGG